MNKNFDVTVIIPSYRAEKTISRAIESVLKDKAKAAIVVIEDGVYDNTSEKILNYSGIYHLVNSENKGAQYSRNRGLEATSTNYVMFLDSDDYIEGDLLFHLSHKIQISDADIVFGPWCLEWDNKPKREHNSYFIQSAEDYLDLFLSGRYVPPCAVMWRTKSLLRIGGWNELMQVNQDGEVIIRAGLNNLKPATVKDGLGVYWQHTSSYRITNKKQKVVLESQAIIKKEVENSLADKANLRLATALASFCYCNSRYAYKAGLVDLGHDWLAAARRHGLNKHEGTSLHKLIAGCFSLRFKEAIARHFNLAKEKLIHTINK